MYIYFVFIYYRNIRHGCRNPKMEEIKPEVVTDPVVVEPVEKTQAEIMRERIIEGKQQQKAGDVVTQALSGNIPQPVAQPTGGTPDVSNQGGSANTAEDAGLKLIEASTGRKFTNVEDAKKYLVGLNSLVGDQSVAKAREAEKMLNDLTGKLGLKDGSELQKYVADLALGQVMDKTVKEVKKEPDDSVIKDIEALKHQNATFELKEFKPEALEFLNIIALDAKSKGVSYVEALKSNPALLSAIEAKVKVESEKSPIVAPSNRTNIDYRKVQELGLKVQSGTATEEEKIALVKAALARK